MKMEFPSSAARMAWKMERPFWRPVSMTERTAAKGRPPHRERKPLVTSRKTTLRTQRPFGGVVGVGDLAVGDEDEEVGADPGEALAQANAIGRPPLSGPV